MFTIINNPNYFFEKLTRDRYWFKFYVWITTIQIALVIAQTILTETAFVNLSLSELSLNILVIVILVSLRNILTWALTTIILMELLIFFYRLNIGFSSMMSIVVASNIVNIIALLISVSIGTLFWLKFHNSSINSFQIASIASLINTDSDLLQYMLTKINAFTIWYIILISIGIKTVVPLNTIKCFYLSAIAILFELFIKTLFLQGIVSLPYFFMQ